MHIAWCCLLWCALRRGPTARELRQWAALARALVERGRRATEAMAAAWRHTYVSAESSPEGRAAAEAAFAQQCAGLSADSAPAQPLALSLSALAAWPHLETMADIAAESQLSLLAVEGSLLYDMACQLVAAEVACLGKVAVEDTPFGNASLPARLLGARLAGMTDAAHLVSSLPEGLRNADALQQGMQGGLRLLWHAAACFAERAAAVDWQQRLLWLGRLHAEVTCSFLYVDCNVVGYDIFHVHGVYASTFDGDVCI